METKQSFCGRPGCGIAKSGHGFLPQSCGNFIQPGSKEANGLKRAHLSLVKAIDADRPHRFFPSGVPVTGEPGEEWCDVDGCVERASHPVHVGIDPCGIDEEETVDVPTLSDAELLAEHRARQVQS